MTSTLDKLKCPHNGCEILAIATPFIRREVVYILPNGVFTTHKPTADFREAREQKVGYVYKAKVRCLKCKKLYIREETFTEEQ